MREFNHWIDHHQDTRNAFLARVWTKRNGKKLNRNVLCIPQNDMKPNKLCEKKKTTSPAGIANKTRRKHFVERENDKMLPLKNCRWARRRGTQYISRLANTPQAKMIKCDVRASVTWYPNDISATIWHTKSDVNVLWRIVDVRWRLRVTTFLIIYSECELSDVWSR